MKLKKFVVTEVTTRTVTVEAYSVEDAIRKSLYYRSWKVTKDKTTAKREKIEEKE